MEILKSILGLRATQPFSLPLPRNFQSVDYGLLFSRGPFVGKSLDPLRSPPPPRLHIELSMFVGFEDTDSGISSIGSPDLDLVCDSYLHKPCEFSLEPSQSPVTIFPSMDNFIPHLSYDFEAIDLLTSPSKDLDAFEANFRRSLPHMASALHYNFERLDAKNQTFKSCLSLDSGYPEVRKKEKTMDAASFEAQVEEALDIDEGVGDLHTFTSPFMEGFLNPVMDLSTDCEAEAVCGLEAASGIPESAIEDVVVCTAMKPVSPFLSSTPLSSPPSSPVKRRSRFDSASSSSASSSSSCFLFEVNAFQFQKSHQLQQNQSKSAQSAKAESTAQDCQPKSSSDNQIHHTLVISSSCEHASFTAELEISFSSSADRSLDCDDDDAAESEDDGDDEDDSNDSDIEFEDDQNESHRHFSLSVHDIVNGSGRHRRISEQSFESVDWSEEGDEQDAANSSVDSDLLELFQNMSFSGIPTPPPHFCLPQEQQVVRRESMVSQYHSVSKWCGTGSGATRGPGRSTKSVSFASDECLVTVHVLENDTNECRKGNWEQLAFDRERFRQRVIDTDARFADIFSSIHRQSVFDRRHGQGDCLCHGRTPQNLE